MKIKQIKPEISINTSREGRLKAPMETINPDVLISSLIIKGENTAKLHEFIVNITQELNPKSKLEFFFTEQFIINSWKLKRFQEIERNILNQLNSISKVSNFEEPIKYRRIRNISRIDVENPSFLEISKYIKLSEQCVYQTLEKLRELQMRRG